MLKKKIIPTLILIMLVSTISATTLSRNLPSTLDSGETFTVTYSTIGKSGKWFSAWQDFVTGCSPIFYRDFMISEGGSKSTLRTFVAPQSGECTFSGIYQFTGESKKDFPTVTINVCSPKTCSGLNKECGTVNDGCGNTLNCGICSSGKTCNNGICESICTPETEKKCYNNDVYWFDSCGDRGSKYEDCGTNGCSNGVCISSEIPIQYANYFNNNPKVKSLTVDSYDEEILGYFWNFIEEIEITGEIYMEKPSCFINAPNSRICDLSEIEWKKILASKIAHSIWLDKNNKVSWDLEDFRIENLRLLLDKDFLFNRGQRRFVDVADFSPSLTYKYTEENIRSSKEDSLYALIDSLRDFRHGGVHIDRSQRCTSDFDCKNLPYNQCFGEVCGFKDLDNFKDMDELFEFKVSSHGCHSSTRISIALARNLNIPAYYNSGWFGGGHATTVFPRIGLLLHGDDIYGGKSKNTPSNKLLASWNFFKEYIEPAGDAGFPRLNIGAFKWRGRYWATCQDCITRENCESKIRDVCCIGSFYTFEGHPGITCAYTDSEINNIITEIMNEC